MRQPSLALHPPGAPFHQVTQPAATPITAPNAIEAHHSRRSIVKPIIAANSVTPISAAACSALHSMR